MDALNRERAAPSRSRSGTTTGVVCRSQRSRRGLHGGQNGEKGYGIRMTLAAKDAAGRAEYEGATDCFCSGASPRTLVANLAEFPK